VPDELEAGPDREVVAVIDVEEALADAGGVRYRYTAAQEEYDGGGEVVVEGERDVERGLSHEIRVTTFSTTAGADEVDEYPTRYESTRETVTRDGTLWVRARPAGRPPGPWSLVWDEVDGPGGDAFDPDGRGMASVVRSAGTVERFAYVATEATTAGELARRFRGTGTDEAVGLTIDVWLDVEGRLHRITTSAGEELDLVDHGLDVTAPEPDSFDEDGSEAYFGELSPEVTGDWELEAEGTTEERAWQVVRAPGLLAGVEVPCRMLLAEDQDGSEGWDDALLVEDQDGPVCGRGGYEMLSSAVAEPALQVLVPMSVWTASSDVPEPLGLAVSPRFAGSPAVILGLDGERIEVPLDDAGLGVTSLPGDLVVASIELDDRSVVCTTDAEASWLEDATHAIELLWGTAPLCARA
jgi:hypothetical protein